MQNHFSMLLEKIHFLQELETLEREKMYLLLKDRRCTWHIDLDMQNHFFLLPEKCILVKVKIAQILINVFEFYAWQLCHSYTNLYGKILHY